MNRNELKEYYRRLKMGQQNSFANADSPKSKVLNEMDRREQNLAFEDPEALTDMYRNQAGSWNVAANRDLPGALENLAADIQDMIDNAVGQVDLDYSDDPLTKKDILDFVIRMLVEEQSVI